MTTFTFLRKLVSYRKGLYLLNALAWSLVYLAPIVPGLLTKQFFDELSGHAAYSLGLGSLLVLLLMAALARISFILFGFTTDVQFRFRIGALLRRNVLRHILKEPGARAIPFSPGEAISSFRDDVDQVEESVSWSVDVLGLTVFAAVSCIILIRIHPQMTLWVFLPLIVVVTAAQLSTALLQKYRAASREATSQVTGAISEMFGTVQSIQVAGAEERMIRRFRRLSDERRQAMLKDTLLTTSLDSVFSGVVHFGTGLILLLAAESMRTGQFTVGDFALFVYYLGFVTHFIQNFGKFITYYKVSAVAKNRLQALLQGADPQKLTEHHPLYLRGTLPGPQEHMGAAGGADSYEPLHSLALAGLSYRYPDTGRGIENIDLRLERGSFTVITGRVGSGKTTLVRTLLGLLPKQTGDIFWNERKVEDPGEYFIPPRSAYTPQIPRLYSDTLRNNILLGLEADEERITRAIHAAVLEDDVTRLPAGLGTMIGPRGVKLSGGQAQRSAAARMFVREAELLVFDDLSSALDVDTESKLWERLAGLREETTCLVVSHRKAALARADRIIVMNNGRIEAEGSLDELLADNEELRRIWYGPEERQGDSGE
ncbi:ATP-binding cassette, subfamily B [Paenibacillus sp. UNCCL117]|uniref:ABC transporter ATP-binding protein n=1 Tax=unclassified Paenibacillus TaxID=185978 RepID=UPI00087F62A8|nr:MULTISPECIES: ABC transporter ATP-binding protein [unclassified Paenibacillus]SDD41369.1 ATP-binding cassette, subfamily B [Paenibacillus sp. cl123]SFW47852.1 ATP-binding cassette, subfamily B [Paenibacillus sp. UNCCL117]